MFRQSLGLGPVSWILDWRVGNRVTIIASAITFLVLVAAKWDPFKLTPDPGNCLACAGIVKFPNSDRTTSHVGI
jgi:hypothetical protein